MDFVHDDIQNRVVVVDGSQYTMSSSAKILFEAAGKDNSDDLYFDQIRVTGVTAPAPPTVPALGALAITSLTATLVTVGLATARRRRG